MAMPDNFPKQPLEPLSDNPFEQLKVRLVVLIFLAISLLLPLLFSVLSALEVLPLQPNDPILAAVLYITIFVGLSGVIVLWARRIPLRLRFLWGRWPHDFSLYYLLLLMLGVFLFSLGAFQLSYLGLSLVAPNMVESTLQQTLLLSAEDTPNPGVYNALMLFSALIVAPITEEFLFRGILLHRWGEKWGVRASIVLTSVLFGVLHFNLIGLFVFGVVMALLYLRTRSLLVVIVAHGLNNAIASVLEAITTRMDADISVDSLAEFRASWWVGVLCVAVSAPWLYRYIRQSWPRPQQQLPYFANQVKEQLDLQG